MLTPRGQERRTWFSLESSHLNHEKTCFLPQRLDHDLPPFHEPNQRDFSDGHGPPWGHGIHFKQLESLAKNIDVFDPGSQESNIDAYLLEVEHYLLNNNI
ncbi:hypothetical protein AMECASPLE_037168 [Ameca splendens]|uniref:Uncharacterized protein n=1 Tax=Ameca splendens TaxID=208324 RepID=A0ABV0XWU7_9TELE